MIGEILAQYSWLWPLAWQSTTALAIGLGGSFVLRRRAVRAHEFLLLALIAAIAVPLLSHLVKQHQWGLLRVRPKAIESDARPIFAIERLLNSEQAATPRTAGALATATEGPAPIHTSSVSSIEWKELVLPLWIVLCAALLVRLAIRFALGYRLARRAAPCSVQEIAVAIERAKTRLGIDSDVQVRSSAETHSPVIWCWGLRPILLVPQETNDNAGIDWQSVVCHELAHWKRRDHLSGLWAELMVCVLPWNPLACWAQRRLVRLSEEACDDWVIASGQVGTRYARTLLGLTPQGRAALLPAVVSSKKGLAVRVRRILADQCSSPRSGRRWSLATAALAASLAVTIAFAQAGPAHSTGMARTTLAHGAVIEQLASTHAIRGIVLDPNGQPTPNPTTHITILPMTSYGVASDKDGHFEIPWSATWIGANQPVYLVARDGRRNLARIIKIDAPDSPITINLEPAQRIKGQVLGPDGQPIHKAVAMLSLPIEFECRSPIAGVETNERGEFTLREVPTGQTYTIQIAAEGYETKLVKAAVPEKGDEEIGLEPITLAFQGAAQSAIAVPGPNANSQQVFGKVHRLNDGEVIKLIKVPFMRQRQDTVMDATRGVGGLLDFAYLCRQYRWDGRLEDGCWYAHDSGLIRIRTVMYAFLNIPSYEFELPEGLGRTHVARGDWIVRKDATTQEKILALEAIIQAELHRPIYFEKRQVERDVIVATGRYAFTPLPGGDPNRLCITAEDTEHLGHEEAESLPQLFARLAKQIQVAIDDRTEPTEARKILYSFDSGSLSPFGLVSPLHATPIDKQKDLPLLLDNLARQTGLTFTVEKRPAEVWFATEEAQ